MPNDIEGLIHDLPRWINIVRYVNDGRDTYGEQEHHEAITLALDELYHRVVELREMYAIGLEPAQLLDGPADMGEAYKEIQRRQRAG